MINNEIELRTSLDRVLLGRLTDELWEFLVDEGYVKTVLDEDEPDDFNYLAEKARRIMGVRSAKRQEDAPEMLEGDRKQQGTSRHFMRQKALSILFAKQATEDKRVIKFRRTVLGEKFPMPFKEVESWIVSQYEKDTKGQKEPDLGGLLEYGLPNDKWARRGSVVKGGVLDNLKSISEKLASTYRWGQAQATVFILTEIPPMVSLYHAQWGINHSLTVTTRIKLTLDPVLTDKEVATIYRQIRQQMLKKDRRGRARYRMLRDKSYALAIFDAEQGEGKTYKEKMKIWNKQVLKEHPDRKYELESNFGRDCLAAKRRILQPDYFDYEGFWEE